MINRPYWSSCSPVICSVLRVIPVYGTDYSFHCSLYPQSKLNAEVALFGLDLTFAHGLQLRSLIQSY